jgi:putative ABC transport system permease protein
MRALIGELATDLRTSLRGLRRSPAMTATIVLTVGLGIGATTTIFSGVNAALLRPLPYEDPARLVRIYTDAPPNRFRFSVADYQALEAQQTQFERIAGYTDRSMAFSDGRVAERLRGKAVTPGYFALLGIRPALGRDFTSTDGRAGTTPAAIVTRSFWEQRLGGRADAIGRPIRLDGADYTVVGVLPASLGPLERGAQFFIATQYEPPSRKGPFFVTVIGRLRAESARAAASQELHAINRRLFPIWKASYQDEKATWALMDLKAHVVGNVSTIAGLALGAVALVWLMACANASNLLIARVTARAPELAVRAALGASRMRVLRHLFAESVLLALAAALAGGALAWVGVGLLGRAGAAYFPRTEEIALDGSVLLVLGIVAGASALLFGILPALQGTGQALDESLRSRTRATTGSLSARRARTVLVGAQFAIATPLLIVAALLIASLNELRRVDVGFDVRNVVTGSILLPSAQYRSPGAVNVFWDDLRQRLGSLPGVAGVAFADGRPPNGVGNFNNFNLEAAPTPPGQSEPVAPWIAVTPEYFRVLGLRLLEGRLLDERDGGDGPDVVVVDAAWARRFFPSGSAVGQRLRSGGCSTCPWTTVVGVVSEVHYAGIDRPDEGAVYTPIAGRPLTFPIESATSRFRYLVLRTTVAPESVLDEVRQSVRALDPALPLSNVATVESLIDDSLQTPRLLSLLVGGFAAVALLLSIVGIYGVMSYYVQQHLREIGIRLAVGATSGGVFRLVVGQGMTIAAIGVALGVAAGFAATRSMAGLLYGVSAMDALTFTMVALFMLGIALLACSVPAARAVRIEPAGVLRGE